MKEIIMKNWALGILAAVCLMGCDVSADPAPVYSGAGYNCQMFCDPYGACRNICNTQYYMDGTGEAFYWDAHFGSWIGRRSYWINGHHYWGFHPGWHGYYAPGVYGHGEPGFRGGFHGGGHYGGSSGGHFGGGSGHGHR
jgi:hypothetical protein